MAEAVKRTRRNLLQFLGKASGTLLGSLGVITAACGNASVDYGVPPSVNVSGEVKSGGENVAGIQVRMLSADGSEVHDSFLSDQYGNYWLEQELTEFSLPDSVLVEATDIDDGENGSFLPADTLVMVEYQQSSAPYVFINVDFELLPDEE